MARLCLVNRPAKLVRRDPAAVVLVGFGGFVRPATHEDHDPQRDKGTEGEQHYSDLIGRGQGAEVYRSHTR